MKLLFSWLQDHIPVHQSITEIADILTQTGLEVENIEPYEPVKGKLQGVVIGEVKTCDSHPDADRLKVTTVDIGTSIVPIVCGASNVAVGQKVFVATVGTTLHPIGQESIHIKKAKIRGIVSEGMICAEDELGLGSSHEGIIVLNTSLPNGTAASIYFEWKDDYIIEIGLTPNRADAASHRGTARDLKAYFRKELFPIDVTSFSSTSNTQPIQVQLENKEACPRYSGLLIKNITVKSSPDWLQNRLKAIGIKPINNIVDITNYILHDLGQPLHAFDADKIEGNKISVKTVLKATSFTTLDGVERKLNEFDLMICDEKKPLAIAGIFGGLHSGVSSSTKNIFLESAYFSSSFIRKTAQAHGLKTDASFRYERGTDPRITIDALKKAAILIQQLAGGEITTIIDQYPTPILSSEISITYQQIWDLIGYPIEKKIIQDILTHLDIELKNKTEESFIASVPPYRVDMSTTADIVEEILRIYGLNQIPLKENLSATYLAEFPEKDKNTIRMSVSRMLAANGFHEIITNSLTKNQTNPIFVDEQYTQGVSVLNPLSEDLSMLRTNLLSSGLEVISYNLNRKQKNIRLFEFGKIYTQPSPNNYLEIEKLSIFLTGIKTEETWMQRNESVSFFDLKNTVWNLLEKLNLHDIHVQEINHPIFQYGLTILKNKKGLGKLGIVQKKQLREMDIKQDVFFAELDWQAMMAFPTSTLSFEEISKYPEVRRDLSLVMDKKITFDQIHLLALNTEKKRLREMNVFDIYEGEKLGKDKKSYSVSFILQDQDKTLSDQEIDQTMNRLMETFEKELHILIRK